MKISDSVTLGDARVDDYGYLEANARTARTGVQTYLGSELGRPDLQAVNVYRDESQVFSKASLASFSKIPITLDHPPEPVTAANWSDYAKGTTGDEVLRDGEYLKIGLKITDAAAVKAVTDGKRELSVGYTTEIVWDEGVAPDGTPFQARQTAITANHIAIVDRGRAGSNVRIGDDAAKWGASPFLTADERKPDMPDNLRTVMVDGLSVSVTDQGAQAIEKLTKDRDEARKATTDAEAVHAKAVAAKDAEIDSLKEKLTAAEAKVPAADAISKMVADRVALEAKCKAIAADVKPEGLTDADLKKAVVAAKVGDEAIKDKAQAYIDARFDILAEDAEKDGAAGDPVAAVIRTGIKPAVQDAPKLTQDAWDKSVEDLNAWRKEA